MNNKFSWSRVWFLIRRYFNENFRQLSMTLGVMFGIMLFFGIMINKTVGDYDHFDGTGFVLWLLLFGIIAFSFTIVGSQTFSSMATKPKRIVAMMVPASKSEKFVSLLLIYNVIAPVLIVASALVVDLLTSLMFLHEPFFIKYLSNIGEFFRQIRIEDYGMEIFIGIVALVCGSMLSSIATYTLGSALWPKKSFIKTFCVLFAIQVFMPFFIPADLTLRFVRWLQDVDWGNLNIHVLAWGGIALVYLFDALLYWLAWCRYRSTQIIQKFMMD